MNKNFVVNTINSLSKDQYQQAAQLFIEIIEVDNIDNLNSYWDIDGGFVRKRFQLTISKLLH